MTQTMAMQNHSLEDVVKAVLEALSPKDQEDKETVQEVAVKTYKGFEDYPDVLQAKHVRAILGLSEAKTYEVLNSEKCPTMTVGKRLLVRKEAFIDYLVSNTNADLIG